MATKVDFGPVWPGSLASWRAQHPSHTALNISCRTDLCDADFAHLSGCGLKALKMSCCATPLITSAAFAHLAGLECLHMNGCDQVELGDDAFLPLAATLKSLNMRLCDQRTITPACLALLEGVVVDCSECSEEVVEAARTQALSAQGLPLVGQRGCCSNSLLHLLPPSALLSYFDLPTAARFQRTCREAHALVQQYKQLHHMPLSNATCAVAGTGVPGILDGAAPAFATLCRPSGLALSPDGQRVYIADSGNHTLRVYHTSQGSVRTLCGLPRVQGAGDGPGDSARFSRPAGLALSSCGTQLYVCDSASHTIRCVHLAARSKGGDEAATVSTLCGAAGQAGCVDGPGELARFTAPCGAAMGPGGLLIVCDAHTVRAVETRGEGAGRVRRLHTSPSSSSSRQSGLTVGPGGEVYWVASLWGDPCLHALTPAGQHLVLGHLQPVRPVPVLGEDGLPLPPPPWHSHAPFSIALARGSRLLLVLNTQPAPHLPPALRTYSAATGQLLSCMELGSEGCHHAPLPGMVLARDGSIVFSGSNDSLLKIV